MEIKWSENEFSLNDFVELYPLPQIVQISEGFYGNDEDTEICQGELFNLHHVKESHYFMATTGNDVKKQIPLNSSHKVHVYYEKSLKDITRCHSDLSQLFPHKYSKIHLQRQIASSYDKKDVYNAGEMLDIVRFDTSNKQLVCLNKKGFHVMFSMSQLKYMNVTEVTNDPMLLSEVQQRYELPLTVRFLPEFNFPGLIVLEQLVTLKTVFASLRDENFQTALTFPSTLEISVFPPSQETLHDPKYRMLLAGLNKNLDVDEVEGIREDEEIYDCVSWFSNVKALPYAQFFFTKSRVKSPSISTCSSVDEDGYLRPVETINRVESLDHHVNDIDESDEGYEIPVCQTTFPRSQLSTDTRPVETINKVESLDHHGHDIDDSDEDYEIPVCPTSSLTRSQLSTVTKCIVNDSDNIRDTDASVHSTTVHLSSSTTSEEDNKGKEYVLMSGSRRSLIEPGFIRDSDVHYEVPNDRQENIVLEEVKKESSTNDKIGESSDGAAPFSIHTPDGSDSEDDEGYTRIPPRPLPRKSLNTSRNVMMSQRKPPSISNLTVQDVGVLLEELNLECYKDVFQRELVDGQMLSDLDEKMMQTDLSMLPFHASTLRKAVCENWRRN